MMMTSNLIIEFKKFLEYSTNSLNYWNIDHEHINYLLLNYGCLEFNKSEILEIQKILPNWLTILPIINLDIQYGDNNVNVKYLTATTRFDLPATNTFIYMYKFGDDRMAIVLNYNWTYTTYECDGMEGLIDVLNNEKMNNLKCFEENDVADYKLWREIDWDGWKYLMDSYNVYSFSRREINFLHDLIVRLLPKSHLVISGGKDCPVGWFMPNNNTIIMYIDKEYKTILTIVKMEDERFGLKIKNRNNNAHWYECDQFDGLVEALKYFLNKYE